MKYIIEIPVDAQYIMINGMREGYCYTQTKNVDDLEELNSDYINENFGELQDEAYQRGLEDAWEAARKLFSSMADSDIEKAFPIEWNNGGFKALMNLQPQEALAKLKAYEDKPSDRIEVGDIVDRYIDGNFDSRGIYLGGNGEIWDCLFWANTLPITLAYPKEQFKKTGKHYDIASILEAMRA